MEPASTSQRPIRSASQPPARVPTAAPASMTVSALAPCASDVPSTPTK